MPVPVIEVITRAIETTLRGIQQVAGYAFNLHVERASKGVIPKDSVAVLELDALEPDPEGAMQHDTWFAPFMITAYVTVPTAGAGAQSLDERMSLMFTEIARALMEDPQWDGYVLNSTLGSPEPNPDSTDMPSIRIPLRVHYRTLRNRPYEL